MEKQYKILYDDNFDRDINKIEDYFYDYNSIDLISRIKEDIEYLKFMPRIHKTLYSVKDPMGEYRRIVSGKFIIIYKIDQDKVIILRIFSHRQDYLNPENFILKEQSTTYNDIILDEEALEEYMIKLIDEVESIPKEEQLYYTPKEFWKLMMEGEIETYGRPISNNIYQKYV